MSVLELRAVSMVSSPDLHLALKLPVLSVAVHHFVVRNSSSPDL